MNTVEVLTVLITIIPIKQYDTDLFIKHKSHTLQNVLKLIRLSEFEGSGHLCLRILVRLIGYDPITYDLEGRCSIQLSYRQITSTYDCVHR